MEVGFQFRNWQRSPMRKFNRLRSTGQLNTSSMKHCIRTFYLKLSKKMNVS